MLDPVDFKGMCDRVARVTGPIDADTRAVYLESLKGYDRDLVLRAMRRVAREHGFYKFPTLAEIMDAIHDSHEDKHLARAYCEKCSSTGFVLVERNGHTSTFRCDCENGDHLPKMIRPFSEVAGMYTPPPDDRAYPEVPMDALEALEDKMIFEHGVTVGKLCGECWTPYRFTHKRRMTVKDLKEFHLTRPCMCEPCYIAKGKEEGQWK